MTVRTALLAALALWPALAAEAAAGELEGVWGLKGEARGPAEGACEDGAKLLTITAETLGYYETVCRILEREELGADRWLLRMECTGEGSTWQKDEIYQLIGDRLVRRPVTGGEIHYARCE